MATSKIDEKSKRKRVVVGLIYGDDKGHSFTDGSDSFWGAEYADVPQAGASVIEALAAKHLMDGMKSLSIDLAKLGIQYAKIKDPEGSAGLDVGLVEELLKS